MTFPGFESRLLARLDRIERTLAALVATDSERRLLLALARATRGSIFSVNELMRHPHIIEALTPLLVAVVGPEGHPRKLGKFLSKVAGAGIGGVTVTRAGTEHAAALWVVSPGILPVPSASDSDIADDASSLEQPCD